MSQGPCLTKDQHMIVTFKHSLSQGWMGTKLVYCMMKMADLGLGTNTFRKNE